MMSLDTLNLLRTKAETGRAPTSDEAGPPAAPGFEAMLEAFEARPAASEPAATAEGAEAASLPTSTEARSSEAGTDRTEASLRDLMALAAPIPAPPPSAAPPSVPPPEATLAAFVQRAAARASAPFAEAPAAAPRIAIVGIETHFAPVRPRAVPGQGEAATTGPATAAPATTRATEPPAPVSVAASKPDDRDIAVPGTVAKSVGQPDGPATRTPIPAEPSIATGRPASETETGPGAAEAGLANPVPPRAITADAQPATAPRMPARADPSTLCGSTRPATPLTPAAARAAVPAAPDGTESPIGPVAAAAAPETMPRPAQAPTTPVGPGDRPILTETAEPKGPARAATEALRAAPASVSPDLRREPLPGSNTDARATAPDRPASVPVGSGNRPIPTESAQPKGAARAATEVLRAAPASVSPDIRHESLPGPNADARQTAPERPASVPVGTADRSIPSETGKPKGTARAATEALNPAPASVSPDIRHEPLPGPNADAREPTPERPASVQVGSGDRPIPTETAEPEGTARAATEAPRAVPASVSPDLRREPLPGPNADARATTAERPVSVPTMSAALDRVEAVPDPAVPPTAVPSARRAVAEASDAVLTPDPAPTPSDAVDVAPIRPVTPPASEVVPMGEPALEPAPASPIEVGAGTRAESATGRDGQPQAATTEAPSAAPPQVRTNATTVRPGPAPAGSGPADTARPSSTLAASDAPIPASPQPAAPNDGIVAASQPAQAAAGAEIAASHPTMPVETIAAKTVPSDTAPPPHDGGPHDVIPHELAPLAPSDAPRAAATAPAVAAARVLQSPLRPTRESASRTAVEPDGAEPAATSEAVVDAPADAVARTDETLARRVFTIDGPQAVPRAAPLAATPATDEVAGTSVAAAPSDFSPSTEADVKKALPASGDAPHRAVASGGAQLPLRPDTGSNAALPASGDAASSTVAADELRTTGRTDSARTPVRNTVMPSDGNGGAPQATMRPDPAVVPARTEAAVAPRDAEHGRVIVPPAEAARIEPAASPDRTQDPTPHAAERPEPAGTPAPETPVLAATAPTAPAGSPLPASPLRQIVDAVSAQFPAAPAAPVRTAVPTEAGPLRILTLQLHPADLGTVLVRMRLQDGRLEMSLRTGREETAERLRREGGALSDLLREAGYAPQSLTIESGGSAAAGTATERGVAQGFSAGTQSGHPGGATPDQQPGRRPSREGHEAAPRAKEQDHDTPSHPRDRGDLYL
ncbi:flagellar hook-length control protein FliK [Methylorubrum rhodinum]|nr:flagellar hook-length control protein FliK [Methylorubrum rhodinum]